MLTAHAQQRPLAALINTQEPGWELVSIWLKQAKNKVQVLPKTPSSQSNFFSTVLRLGTKLVTEGAYL